MLAANYVPRTCAWKGPVQTNRRTVVLHSRGMHGLRTTNGIVAGTAKAIFPKAKFYHKEGCISTYSLDLVCVDDRTESGKRLHRSCCHRLRRYRADRGNILLDRPLDQSERLGMIGPPAIGVN